MSLQDKIDNATPTDWVTRGWEKHEINSTVVNARIAAAITLERRKARLTRSDLAKKLNVRTYMVTRWEQGEHDFTISEIYKINEVLDISNCLKNILKILILEEE